MRCMRTPRRRRAVQHVHAARGLGPGLASQQSTSSVRRLSLSLHAPAVRQCASAPFAPVRRDHPSLQATWLATVCTITGVAGIEQSIDGRLAIKDGGREARAGGPHEHDVTHHTRAVRLGGGLRRRRAVRAARRRRGDQLWREDVALGRLESDGGVRVPGAVSCSDAAGPSSSLYTQTPTVLLRAMLLRHAHHTRVCPDQHHSGRAILWPAAVRVHHLFGGAGVLTDARVTAAGGRRLSPGSATRRSGAAQTGRCPPQTPNPNLLLLVSLARPLFYPLVLSRTRVLSSRPLFSAGPRISTPAWVFCMIAVGETVILLHPPYHVAGASTWVFCMSCNASNVELRRGVVCVVLGWGGLGLGARAGRGPLGGPALRRYGRPRRQDVQPAWAPIDLLAPSLRAC